VEIGSFAFRRKDEIAASPPARGSTRVFIRD
jgi:hypothetical protein